MTQPPANSSGLLSRSDWSRKLLNPSSVALIGASADPSKLSGAIFANLQHGQAKLYPVNSKATDIAGVPCYPSVTAIPDEVDLAVIAVPSSAVLDVFETCVAKGIESVVVVTGGLGEIGEAGKEVERKLTALARASGVRILGPNTVGHYVPAIGLDTTFMPMERWLRPKAGPVAFVCQSGALGLDATEISRTYDAGVSAFVSLGNKADLNESDFVEMFAADEATRCIALYLEDFADGRAFAETCRRVAREKPIVVAKAGRSEAGSKAAALHTGALASSDRVVSGVLDQVGVVRAYDIVELVDLSLALTYGQPLHQPRLAVLTFAGGYGVMLSDYLTSPDRGIGGTLATLDPRTQERLRGKLLPYASVQNPVDLTGSANNAHFEAALAALEDDPNVDAIVISLVPYPPSVDERIVETVERWHERGTKPLVCMVTGLISASRIIRRLWKSGILAYPTPWQAARAVDALCQRGEFLTRLNESLESGEE